ncbi:MAG: hypothetical protein RLZZ03_1181, partial [Pseudomonadota bacterium]
MDQPVQNSLGLNQPLRRKTMRANTILQTIG